MNLYWQDLSWGCYTSFFAHLYQSHGPWFTPKFPFRSISWEQMDRISPIFIYAFILTRSTLGLLHIIFTHLYQSYGLDLRQNFISVQYLQNKWTIWPIILFAIIFTRSISGLLHVIFCSCSSRVRALQLLKKTRACGV